MNDVLFRSASQMAEMIRRKEISSEELVRAHLQWIEAVNPVINAVVHLAAERALREAKRCDSEIARGGIRGPLHGVPVTVKDSLETADMVTTSGTLGRAGHIPERDAATVAALRQAGAVVIGKTNVPELCLAFESDNLVYGRTNNPYDVTRTSGGSSGGEAAIIAAAGSPLGLGSDAGGSVRLPAHFCGIATIKPTSGRLPKTGHFLPPGGLADRLWQIGPMARYVADLILVLPALAQADGIDASVIPMPLGNPGEVTASMKKLRVAFYTDNGVAPPTAETRKTLVEAAKALEQACGCVEEARPDGVTVASSMWCEILAPDGGLALEALLSDIGSTPIHALTEQFLSIVRPRAMRATQVMELLGAWDALRSRMLSLLSRYDVILCPAAASPAIAHGSSYRQLDTFTYTMAFNFSGWPAAVVRCGTSPEGLPIGVQVAAAPWREDVALAVAQHLEATVGGWLPSSALLAGRTAPELGDVTQG
jgi:amidase